jgi:isoquinoline 1-oxidoreductase beta subunit
MGWDTPPAPGRSRGIAVFSHWESYVAQAAEISVSEDKEIVLHRIVSAVDIGPVVNPDLVKAQMESAVIFALSSLFYGEITLVDGVVQQKNYDDYRVLRMFEAPQADTVILPSTTHIPGGVGELGVPCVAPAVVNAIFAATGDVIRELPLKNLGYRIGERHAAAGARK